MCDARRIRKRKLSIDSCYFFLFVWNYYSHCRSFSYFALFAIFFGLSLLSYVAISAYCKMRNKKVNHLKHIMQIKCAHINHLVQVQSCSTIPDHLFGMCWKHKPWIYFMCVVVFAFKPYPCSWICVDCILQANMNNNEKSKRRVSLSNRLCDNCGRFPCKFHCKTYILNGVDENHALSIQF